MKRQKPAIGKALDYFVRNSDNRATVYAAVAEDTAGQILRAEMGQRVIPAKELSNVLSSSKYNSVTAERAFIVRERRYRQDLIGISSDNRDRTK